MSMQTANFLLALGGDLNNTVPKFGVTAGEIAVLQAIHGADAILELEPAGDVERPHRDELERLRLVYTHAKDGEGQRIVDLVYPGRGARVVEALDDLGLSPEQFKAEKRIEAPVVEKKAKAARGKAVVAEDQTAPAADEGENADAVFK